METKVCNKCGVEKPYFEYHKKKSSKDGYVTICKSCRKTSLQQYYKDNKENILLKRKKELEIFPEKIKERRKKTYQNNKDKRIEYVKTYYINNKESILNTKKNYISNRRKNDAIFKLQMVIRSRLDKFINGKTNNFMQELLGCSFDELKKHIESQFTEGMSWNNHSIYGWHIDHKIPLSKAKSEKELYYLCHYSNLQPLWAQDNLKKSNKIIF
jgi:hypothetical protein